MLTLRQGSDNSELKLDPYDLIWTAQPLIPTNSTLHGDFRLGQKGESYSNIFKKCWLSQHKFLQKNLRKFCQNKVFQKNWKMIRRFSNTFSDNFLGIF